MPRLALALALLATQAAADPLSGKSYIIQLSSTQYSSGYGEYLLPPLAKVMQRSGLKAKNGPGADLVVNVEPASDVGAWVGTGTNRVWLYTISATVGISPETYDKLTVIALGMPARLSGSIRLSNSPNTRETLARLISSISIA